MSKLSDKVAVVTGASKGIGASIATHLAAEGAAVVVNYASSKEGADRVVAEIVRNGGRAVAIQADVARKADIERLFAEAVEPQRVSRRRPFSLNAASVRLRASRSRAYWSPGGRPGSAR
jgi:NAD(P)-dependent dehydrogenase (short-subunit alcohol dehydrogenase family)